MIESLAIAEVAEGDAAAEVARCGEVSEIGSVGFSPDTRIEKTFVKDVGLGKESFDPDKRVVDYEKQSNVVYEKDCLNRVVRCEGDIVYTPENVRDTGAQKRAGGVDRLPNDDGGHIVSREHGGSSESDNLVAMRSTLNRGDFKITENAETAWLKNGRAVHENVSLIYEGDSTRPSIIEKTYSDGTHKNIGVFDNDAGSTRLLEKLKGEISEVDFNRLNEEIEDMKADGNEVSVLSYLKETGGLNGDTIKVSLRNETEGERLPSHYYKVI